MESTTESLSSLFGSLSMVAWLGAQFPQIIVNWKNSSVQGLSLPFLIQWLLGDTTNLIGAVLTHQLPFQIYLAMYFCVVDIVLVAQYYHYSHINPAPPLPPLDAHHPHYRSSSIERSPYPYLSHFTPSLSSLRSYSRSQSRARSHPQLASNPPRSLSHSAADSRHPRWSRRSMSAAPHLGLSDDLEAALFDTHERGRRPLSSSNNRTSFSNLHISNSYLPSSSVPSNPDDSSLPPQSATSSSAARITFLGIFAFFTFLPSFSSSASFFSSSHSPLLSSSSSSLQSLSSSYSSPLPSSLQSHLLHQFTSTRPNDTKLIIGETSAWICACLYFTSRMPQIWKNFRRRSVEGLSMLLFIMAFTGNLFYCASILVNPKARTSHQFVVESIPFLIGAGGTLLFDTTIVMQSFIYSPHRKLHRRSSYTSSNHSNNLHHHYHNPHHHIRHRRDSSQHAITNADDMYSVSHSPTESLTLLNHHNGDITSKTRLASLERQQRAQKYQTFQHHPHHHHQSSYSAPPTATTNDHYNHDNLESSLHAFPTTDSDQPPSSPTTMHGEIDLDPESDVVNIRSRTKSFPIERREPTIEEEIGSYRTLSAMDAAVPNHTSNNNTNSDD